MCELGSGNKLREELQSLVHDHLPGLHPPLLLIQ